MSSVSCRGCHGRINPPLCLPVSPPGRRLAKRRPSGAVCKRRAPRPVPSHPESVASPTRATVGDGLVPSRRQACAGTTRATTSVAPTSPVPNQPPKLGAGDHKIAPTRQRPPLADGANAALTCNWRANCSSAANGKSSLSISRRGHQGHRWQLAHCHSIDPTLATRYVPFRRYEGQSHALRPACAATPVASRSNCSGSDPAPAPAPRSVV